jgi:multidrug efflux pump
VAISLVVSLTTTPMLAARLLDGQESQSWIMRKARRAVEWSEARYARNLDWALAHRGLVMLVLLLTVALNIWLIAIAPKGFFPQQDTGGLMGGVRADQSISFADLQDKLTRITRIVKSDPAVDTVVSFAGGSRAGGGFLFATLKDRSQRPPATEVIGRLRPACPRARCQPVPQSGAGSPGGRAPDQQHLSIRAQGRSRRRAPGRRAKAGRCAENPSRSDHRCRYRPAGRGADAFVEVDRDAAARLGIPMQTVDATLYDAFGQRQVANIYSGLNQYHVVMEADRQFNGSPEALNNIYLPAGTISSASSTANLTARAAAAGGSRSPAAARSAPRPAR